MTHTEKNPLYFVQLPPLFSWSISLYQYFKNWHANSWIFLNFVCKTGGTPICWLIAERPTTAVTYARVRPCCLSECTGSWNKTRGQTQKSQELQGGCRHHKQHLLWGIKQLLIFHNSLTKMTPACHIHQYLIV